MIYFLLVQKKHTISLKCNESKKTNNIPFLPYHMTGTQRDMVRNIAHRKQYHKLVRIILYDIYMLRYNLMIDQVMGRSWINNNNLNLVQIKENCTNMLIVN